MTRGSSGGAPMGDGAADIMVSEDDPDGGALWRLSVREGIRSYTHLLDGP